MGVAAEAINDLFVLLLVLVVQRVGLKEPQRDLVNRRRLGLPVSALPALLSWAWLDDLAACMATL